MLETKNRIGFLNTLAKTTRIERELINNLIESNKSISVNFNEYEVLEILFNNDNMTQFDLVEQLCMNRLYISRCLKSFEEKRYISRSFINKDDKTVTICTLTERGKIAYKVVKGKMEELDKRILEKLSPEDSEKTSFYLNNLHQIITGLVNEN